MKLAPVAGVSSRTCAVDSDRRTIHDPARGAAIAGFDASCLGSTQAFIEADPRGLEVAYAALDGARAELESEKLPAQHDLSTVANLPWTQESASCYPD